MTDSTLDRLARVRRFLECLRPLADRTHPLGRAAREELPRATGLARENVEWALTHAFEIDATDSELRILVEGTVVAPRAHVVLSANVFVAALRAIAIGLASSNRVEVRPSRRETKTLEFLRQAAPGMFQLVTELNVSSGDHVWVYGSDTTLRGFRNELAKGVVLHAHGDGYGVHVVDDVTRLQEGDYTAMALDLAAFDQRGCLSPRYALLVGSAPLARTFAQRLLAAMNELEHSIPFGGSDETSLAATIRHRETWRYLGEVFEGNGGLVTLDTHGLDWGDPPTRRTVHVRTVDDPRVELAARAASITAVGCATNSSLLRELNSVVPRARVSAFGAMQRPRLDGPVDRRSDPAGIPIE